MTSPLKLVPAMLSAASNIFSGRPPAKPAVRPRPSRPAPNAASTAAPAPLAPLLEWESSPPPAPAPADPAVRAEELRIALRERYVAARFPGMFGGAVALGVPSEVIKLARLYQEDGKFDAAQELLDMAIEQSPAAAELPLAQLELAFLAREPERFTELARCYRTANPEGAAWPEICKLGQALSPGEELFGPVQAAGSHDQYGPWPDTPNWIQASWDLTADVLGADFHHALIKRSPK